jgi:hypothetical protein
MYYLVMYKVNKKSKLLRLLLKGVSYCLTIRLKQGKATFNLTRQEMLKQKILSSFNIASIAKEQ